MEKEREVPLPMVPVRRGISKPVLGACACWKSGCLQKQWHITRKVVESFRGTMLSSMFSPGPAHNKSLDLDFRLPGDQSTFTCL